LTGLPSLSFSYIFRVKSPPNISIKKKKSPPNIITSGFLDKALQYQIRAPISTQGERKEELPMISAKRFAQLAKK